MIDGVMVVSPKIVEEVDITQFKDGDIITCGWSTGDRSYSWISVLRGEIERITNNLFIADYCTLNCDGTYSLENGDSDSATYVRYATEEAKKLLFDKIDQEGYKWLADERKLVKKRWKPQFEETYHRPLLQCFDEVKFVFMQEHWRNNVIDDSMFKKGWVFRTEEECQQFCEKLNEAILNIKS